MSRHVRIATVLSVLAVLLLATVPLVFASTPPKLRADEAAQHVGEVATVCGLVASARYATSVRGQPTFINLDKPYPNQIFTVLIWGSDRPAFGSPETTLAGKRICANGMIQLYKGKPEIIAKKPSQISVEESQ